MIHLYLGILMRENNPTYAIEQIENGCKSLKNGTQFLNGLDKKDW
jgi:hypothetical protein